jgi:Rad3-related DNA helicase
MDQTEIPHPKSYGLPHNEWRPKQHDSVLWGLDVKRNGLMEAPTGSGKTAVIRAIAATERVVALTRTLNLQVANYGQSYSFDVLKGRRHYPCAHPDLEGMPADECIYAGNMTKCAWSTRCKYRLQRDLVKRSKRASLNYWLYFFLRQKWEDFDYLAMDEAHDLSELTISLAGVTIRERDRLKWGLPQFPIIMELSPERQALYGIAIHPYQDAIAWLVKCQAILRARYNDLSRVVQGDPAKRKRLRQCELFGKKVASTLEALQNAPDDWYIKSGRKVGSWNGRPCPAFVAKPLTARHHFPRYFLGNGHKSILMSATIGDPGAFAEELGIAEFEWRQLESVWAPETRPIHILNVPRMSRSNTLKHPSAFEKQADAIAKAIRYCPEDWSGIIHVTRKAEAPAIAERLANRGLADRVYVPPEAPTDQQMQAWQARKARVPNSIILAWDWWAGVDLLDEKICIAAKSPAPYLGDEFEQMRMEYSRKTYNWRTANVLAQGLGRTRRGRPEDYKTTTRMEP